MPPGGMAGSFFFSGFSAIMASVVSMGADTEAAFWMAKRTTLVGSITPAAGRFPETQDKDQQRFWRRVLRLAAFCYDIGHLPFSHAAEDLLPEGQDHEKMTRALILSPEMQGLWAAMSPRPEPEDIVKLAISRKKAPDLEFNDLSSRTGEG